MGTEICISNKLPGDADVQDHIFDNHWCVVVAVSSGEVWWSSYFSLWLELEKSEFKALYNFQGITGDQCCYAEGPQLPQQARKVEDN